MAEIEADLEALPGVRRFINELPSPSEGTIRDARGQVYTALSLVAGTGFSLSSELKIVAKVDDQTKRFLSDLALRYSGTPQSI